MTVARVAMGSGSTAASSPKPDRKGLEGVPKVGYQFSGFAKCTTFSATLESVMNSGLWERYVKQNNEGAKKLADPSVRRILADQLLRCRELEEQAIRVIESLLARIE